MATKYTKFPSHWKYPLLAKKARDTQKEVRMVT